MLTMQDIKNHAKNIACALPLMLCASFTQAAEQDCSFLDYTKIQKPQSTSIAQRWRIKTHIMAEDNGDPCALNILDEHKDNNADTIYNIASLTKKMTAVIAWDEIKAGRLDPEEELIISDWAYEQSSQRTEKTTITVREALQTMMIASANDAATTLAVRIMSGKNQKWGTKDVKNWEEQFAQQHMTAKAHELGMVHTNYHNATGLDMPLRSDKILNGVRYYSQPLSTSTPREQAFLSSYIRNTHPEIVSDSALPKIYLQNTRTPYTNLLIRNTNRLLPGSIKKDADPIEDVIGLKTGGLTASGANQSTIVEFNVQGQAHHLIIETAGDSKNKHFKSSARARNNTIHTLVNAGKEMLNEEYSTPPALTASAYSPHPTGQR